LTVPGSFSSRRSTGTRWSQAGNPFDTSLWMKPFLPMPAGKRSIVTGRRATCGSISGATVS